MFRVGKEKSEGREKARVKKSTLRREKRERVGESDRVG
jgi:hypothetical protein